jgi:hypothetical protein
LRTDPYEISGEKNVWPAIPAPPPKRFELRSICDLSLPADCRGIADNSSLVSRDISPYEIRKTPAGLVDHNVHGAWAEIPE